jgi:hypothetical protein
MRTTSPRALQTRICCQIRPTGESDIFFMLASINRVTVLSAFFVSSYSSFTARNFIQRLTLKLKCKSTAFTQSYRFSLFVKEKWISCCQDVGMPNTVGTLQLCITIRGEATANLPHDKMMRGTVSADFTALVFCFTSLAGGVDEVRESSTLSPRTTLSI